MSYEPEYVRGAKAAIHFDGKRCIHSRQCVLRQPAVFKANVEGAWIDPDAAPPDALLEVAHNCPSGAITIERFDGGLQEAPPAVNLITVRENGPLAFHAELSIGGQSSGFRVTLCRCGQSQAKPFCDGAHAASQFSATGEPSTTPSQPLGSRNGPVNLSPAPNGPLLVKGNVEIISGTGRTLNRTSSTALCRCGASSNKPYCDGSHARIGFVAP
jgi:CDGSH-type Zn-finger protein/uncharacterized Fe-S cluster protein YjdI